MYLGAVVLNFSFLLTRPGCRLGPGQLVATQEKSGLGASVDPWVQFHAAVDGDEGGRRGIYLRWRRDSHYEAAALCKLWVFLYLRHKGTRRSKTLKDSRTCWLL